MKARAWRRGCRGQRPFSIRMGGLGRERGLAPLQPAAPRGAQIYVKLFAAEQGRHTQGWSAERRRVGTNQRSHGRGCRGCGQPRGAKKPCKQRARSMRRAFRQAVACLSPVTTGFCGVPPSPHVWPCGSFDAVSWRGSLAPGLSPGVLTAHQAPPAAGNTDMRAIWMTAVHASSHMVRARPRANCGIGSRSWIESETAPGRGCCATPLAAFELCELCTQRDHLRSLGDLPALAAAGAQMYKQVRGG